MSDAPEQPQAMPKVQPSPETITAIRHALLSLQMQLESKGPDIAAALASGGSAELPLSSGYTLALTLKRAQHLSPVMVPPAPAKPGLAKAKPKGPAIKRK